MEFILPGSKGYRADLPWVMKIRCNGHLAMEVYVYVDNGRVTGHSAEQTGLRARAYGAGCTRLGVQPTMLEYSRALEVWSWKYLLSGGVSILYMIQLNLMIADTLAPPSMPRRTSREPG